MFLKVFGRQKEQALKLREAGESKYEVEQATKTTVAIYNAHFEVKGRNLCVNWIIRKREIYFTSMLERACRTDGRDGISRKHRYFSYAKKDSFRKSGEIKLGWSFKMWASFQTAP